ncbi:MAG: hypothetical protein WC460_00555 [Patescibacteria group bacterium]
MRNFTIILFIFFVFFLIISLFVTDPLPLFFTLFLAFVISFICLAEYTGKLRGILAGIFFVAAPFLIEYLFLKFNVPFSQSSILQNFTIDQFNLFLTLTNLFTLVTIPLIFITSLFFAYKIKIFVKIKSYHKTFLIIASSLLVALNFLIITSKSIDSQNFIKWMAISLIIFLIIIKLIKFKAEALEIFKDLPILIYLSIYGVNALRRLESFNLVIAAFLVILYLILLFNEYKIRKIALSFKL